MPTAEQINRSLTGIIDMNTDVIAALAAERDEAKAENSLLRAALEWYAEQVAGCRKLGSIGDPARHALDADGGERARRALSPE